MIVKKIEKKVKAGGYCFHIDTIVYKLNEESQTTKKTPMKLLQPGDKILSYDSITKKQFFDTVCLKLIYSGDKEWHMMKIRYKEGIHEISPTHCVNIVD